MQLGNRRIDHIVYCVYDLDKAIIEFEKRLGVAPVFGGYHTTQGTKNAILNLGNECYLELLAADAENESFTDERWMGIDRLSAPKITRWSLKSDTLEEDSSIVNDYNPAMGCIEGGARKLASGGTLTWGIIMPLPQPEVEAVPFMTDWSASARHPTDSLEDVCRLVDISIQHPNPLIIQGVLQQLSIDMDVLLSEQSRIHIKVECPNGIVDI